MVARPFAEINVFGNLVGTNNDIVELMTLSAQGCVKLRTKTYSLHLALDAIDDPKMAACWATAS